VLSYLQGKEGILAVAAAGNHHEMLFPALLPGVISAGALDLTWLGETGKPRASAQTPPGTRALVLGYGLYLSGDSGDTSPVWPAPPGSSYAAALFTGWLGGTLTGQDAPVALKGDRWTPVPTAAGLALALDGVPVPGSELAAPARLFERALGDVPTFGEKGSQAVLRLDGPAPPLPELSLLHADAGNGPQPGVNPCVPCRGIGEGLESSAPILVDLSYSSPLPTGADLIAVFLRVGGELYAFDRSRDPDLLAEMAAGQVEELVLDEAGGVLEPGEQPSLVLVVNVGGTAYWHEVPLNLHL
jgi:hypothetical protein